MREGFIGSGGVATSKEGVQFPTGNTLKTDKAAECHRLGAGDPE